MGKETYMSDMDHSLTLYSGMADYEPVIALSPRTTHCNISHVCTNYRPCNLRSPPSLHHIILPSRSASGVSHDRL
jgi:hypothetical protein